MIFAHRIKDRAAKRTSAYKIAVSNGRRGPNKILKKNNGKKGKRNNNANVSDVIYWRTFLQKYTREHDKHEPYPQIELRR